VVTAILFSIDIHPDYADSNEYLKSYLIKHRLEKLECLGIENFIYSNKVIFDSNTVPLESVIFVLNSALKEDLITSEQLWHDQLSETNSYICERYLYPNGNIVLSYFLKSSKEGHVRMELYTISDNQDLLKKVDNIRKALDIITSNKDDSVISTNVYWKTTHGLGSVLSNIICPHWDEIENNYIPDVKKSVKGLIETIKKEDEYNGRLILWYGEPGTGKTWAIRSLIRELKNKYVPIIITDSDVFCEMTSYYYDVIQEFAKPCLFIMEDSAESILTETRTFHGNRISKLLNLTDGLMAQGRNDLFLISFNEDIKEIDPAFVRHGRCLNVTEFLPFDRGQAEDWLKEKGINFENISKNKLTLADLYGILSLGVLNEHQKKEKKVGFF